MRITRKCYLGPFYRVTVHWPVHMHRSNPLKMHCQLRDLFRETDSVKGCMQGRHECTDQNFKGTDFSRAWTFNFLFLFLNNLLKNSFCQKSKQLKDLLVSASEKSSVFAVLIALCHVFVILICSFKTGCFLRAKI